MTVNTQSPSHSLGRRNIVSIACNEENVSDSELGVEINLLDHDMMSRDGSLEKAPIKPEKTHHQNPAGPESSEMEEEMLIVRVNSLDLVEKNMRLSKKKLANGTTRRKSRSKQKSRSSSPSSRRKKNMAKFRKFRSVTTDNESDRPIIGRIQQEIPPPSYEQIDAQFSSIFNDMPLLQSSIPNESQFNIDSWLSSHCMECDKDLGSDGAPLPSLIVHEIRRANWTWCIAWSPDGSKLALSSRANHLSVIDTASSASWKIIHNADIISGHEKGSPENIRSIAWGPKYIAIGGSGDSVAVLDTNTFVVLHVIPCTGFVGSLDWRADTKTLAIGNREENCLIAELFYGTKTVLESKIVCSVARKDWVNVVAFSPRGTILAIGDRHGIVSIYAFGSSSDSAPELTFITEYHFCGSILSLEWAKFGKFLCIAGEDYKIYFVNTSSWEIVHEMQRDRWVQFVAPCNTGSHVAVGGGGGALSIVNDSNAWNASKDIGVEWDVVLTAKWHPTDQYIAIGGQHSSMKVVETSNMRHIDNGRIQFSSGIRAIAISSDGKYIVVGRDDGVVSFLDTTGKTFLIVYEVVLGIEGAKAIKWSPKGDFVAVGGGDNVMIINASRPLAQTGPYKESIFSLRKVIRGFEAVESLSFSPDENFLVVSGPMTKVFYAGGNFICLKIFKKGVKGASFSSNGKHLAIINPGQILTMMDVSAKIVSKWRTIFEANCDSIGTALAWCPYSTENLQYLAFGGNTHVTLIEVHTKEESWETVIKIPRQGKIFDLDWRYDGMLAIAVGNGTATIMDFSYLLNGKAVCEMDYKWQRQGITCLTEIQRKKGGNETWKVLWIGKEARRRNFLALGNSNGVFEIIDLTERKKSEALVDSIGRGGRYKLKIFNERLSMM